MRKLGAWLLFWMCCGLALAQPPRHFRHFTQRDGLSDNRVQAIAQDAQGFIWIGTTNGLCRFDGYGFKQWKPDPKLGNRSIRNGEIRDIVCDLEGYLWIATADGLERMDPRTMTFERWLPQKGDEYSLPSADVRDLHLDNRGALWVSTDNRNPCRYHHAKKRFETYPWREFLPHSLPNFKPDDYATVYSIRGRDASHLWLYTNLGLFDLDIYSGIPTYHQRPDKSEEAKSAPSCPETLYAGSWWRGILRYQPCLGRWERLPLPMEHPADTLPVVMEVFPYNQGHLAITANGLYWLPPNSVNVERIQPWEDRPSTSPRGSVSVAVLDRQGGLWLGGSEGLWLAEPLQRQFHYQKVAPNPPMQYDNGLARVLGLSNGGLLSIDFHRHLLHIQLPGQAQRDLDVGGFGSLLQKDRDGRIWVGGGNRLYLLDTLDWALRPFPIELSTWEPDPKGYFVGMAQDSRGRYWFANSETGALVLDPTTSTWWQPTEQDGLIGKYLSAIVADPQRKQVWLGSFDYGLFLYDERKDSFRLFQHDPKLPQSSLASYVVRDLALDGQGHLLIATDPNGLSVLNQDQLTSPVFFNIGPQQGLPSGRVTGIAIDQQARIWLCTLGGLACLQPETGSILFFDSEDGLPSDYLDQPPACLPDGQIAVGLRYGFVHFQPDSLLQTVPDAAILLSSFKVFDKELGDSLPLSQLQSLDLTWRENFFQIDWASAAVSGSRRLQYAHRLLELEENWHAAEGRHASYTNVPPGDYILELRAGKAGIWQETGLRLPIHIATPWWQTWWFRLLVILLIAGIISLVYRWRISQVRREEQLRSEFDQQIARTEMAALRAQMNPHFVFNCLSSINRYILVNQPDEASAYLTKFSRLIRLILDNSRTDTVLLSRELDALRLYVELEQMRFDHQFSYHVEVDPNLQPEHMEVPPLLIQPYLENAIWHGLMHKKGQGKLLLRIQGQPEGHLWIEIEDDGIGRAKAMELKSRSATTQKSHGMKVTHERLEAINRLYGTQATVETIDLNDSQGQPAGTRIIIRL